MNNDKIIEESTKILVEKLGKELKKYAKTGREENYPGDTTTVRTNVKVPDATKLSPKAKAKLASHKSRSEARSDKDTSWAVDLPSGHQKAKWSAQRKREDKHRAARGVKKKKGSKVEENITFKQFCEGLEHVEGSKLTKALKKSEALRKKSIEAQENLPKTKYGDAKDESQYDKHENRQYRLERARDEIKGEMATRLRTQGVRAASNVSDTEREAKVAGDMLKPRAKKPKHKKKLKSSAVITVKPKGKKKEQAQIGFKS